MKHLSIDLETFSSVDLKKRGLYKYVESPDFEILLFAYSIDFGPVEILDLAQGERIPDFIINMLFDQNIIKHAYNATFEWYCLNKMFYREINTFWLFQWQCTMLHGLYCGYPGSLARIGEAMNMPKDKRKLSTGNALIKTFCTPCKPTKRNGHRTRTLPHHEPEKWKLFKEYCKQDVATEMEVEKRLQAFPVPQKELNLWQIDHMINSRGVAIDTKLVNGALTCSEIINSSLENEAIQLSGLDNPKSVKQLIGWLTAEIEEDLEIPDLQKETVKELINNTDNEKVVRMLEIRQELSKTSLKKYEAMEGSVCADERVRGLLQFYGANRTGRWAGRLVQVQNLPRNNISTLDLARELAIRKNLTALELIYGNIPDTLSQLIRTAFIPAEDKILIAADFSAIEARVLAWLAEEQWRQDVFATHGKIYEASASAMFGVPIEKIAKGNPEYSLRQKGKVAELALGYQGASGALMKMGALKMGLTEEELPEIVSRWRRANKRIVDFWYSVENVALEVVKTGRTTGYKNLIFARETDYQNNQDFLTIQLPNGRKLFYAKPFISKNEKGRESIHFMGNNQTSKKWEVIPTYGGKLTENIVQAIARDCLAESIYSLEMQGFAIVFHVHDEVIVETDNKIDLEYILKMMGRPISWAPGLILRADGFSTKYYKKE